MYDIWFCWIFSFNFSIFIPFGFNVLCLIQSTCATGVREYSTLRFSYFLDNSNFTAPLKIFLTLLLNITLLNSDSLARHSLLNFTVFSHHNLPQKCGLFWLLLRLLFQWWYSAASCHLTDLWMDSTFPLPVQWIFKIFDYIVEE